MAFQKYPYAVVFFVGTAWLATLVTIESVAQQQELKQPVSLDNAAIDSLVRPAGCDEVGCREICRTYETVCCPERVEKEVKKHCWKVAPKMVCIPGFCWPWDRSRAKTPSCGDCCESGCETCGPKCGRVRCINVLEKHEYKCKKCGYEWNVKRVCTGNGQCDSEGSCCPDCGCKGCD